MRLLTHAAGPDSAFTVTLLWWCLALAESSVNPFQWYQDMSQKYPFVSSSDLGVVIQLVATKVFNVNASEVVKTLAVMFSMLPPDIGPHESKIEWSAESRAVRRILEAPAVVAWITKNPHLVVSFFGGGSAFAVLARAIGTATLSECVPESIVRVLPVDIQGLIKTEASS